MIREQADRYVLYVSLVITDFVTLRIFWRLRNTTDSSSVCALARALVCVDVCVYACVRRGYNFIKS